MEIRNGSFEEQAAVKTVLEEGDTNQPPARCADYTFYIFYNCTRFVPDWGPRVSWL